MNIYRNVVNKSKQERKKTIKPYKGKKKIELQEDTCSICPIYVFTEYESYLDR